MDAKLVETLQIINDKYGNRVKGSVFIPIRDFPWHGEGNNQLTQLFNAGLVTKPRYFDILKEVKQCELHFGIQGKTALTN